MAARRAAGLVAAEMLAPYPPGSPVALPGERLNRAVPEYLHSGVGAGMLIPDAADSEPGSVRVAVER
ncbi:Orn/Lys/Arg family decarboxylase [Streptomyces sp. CLV115]|uniref:Orn/Lys/Arg family decarboxylase n=1 Tax=Streptomyces sp. CLV115 TaxID=3138502 RepID=UPI00406BF17E